MMNNCNSRSSMNRIRIFIGILSILLLISCVKEEVKYTPITSPYTKENTPEVPEIRLNKKKFSSTEWKAAGSIDRRKYSEDILISNMLAGKNKNEVVELLGEPDHKYEKENTITYSIDSGQLLNNGERWIFSLNIVFDNNGIVIRYFVTT